MKETLMDPKIYEQLGELKGRFNTFEQNMSTQFAEVKQAIKEQSVVPYSIYDKHVETSDTRYEKLRTDIEIIKDTLQIKEHTITGRVATFLDNAIVKIIGTGLITVLLIGVYLNYQKQIDTLTRKVNNVDSTQQIIQKDVSH